MNRIKQLIKSHTKHIDKEAYKALVFLLAHAPSEVSRHYSMPGGLPVKNADDYFAAWSEIIREIEEDTGSECYGYDRNLLFTRTSERHCGHTPVCPDRCNLLPVPVGYNWRYETAIDKCTTFRRALIRKDARHEGRNWQAENYTLHSQMDELKLRLAVNQEGYDPPFGPIG
jgi:hypothetical protein